ncbi:hypothetical protein GFD25_08575 [Bifidobacterium aerophilum]|uniref:Type II secretion system protein GspF domain-containing protein n=2 Tax=Bifidobacterium aerophilum TaxID=1798155 RepID=A0A6N9Z6P6_9BIFI|nr:hypothetical protein [Bifidobacterium aerophilum]
MRVRTTQAHDDVPGLDGGEVSAATVLALTAAVVRQGASIPRAVETVGSSIGGRVGRGLCRVCDALLRGDDWHDAWGAAEGGLDAETARGFGAAAGGREPVFAMLEEALEPAWRHGTSPVSRLETALEQLDRDERSRIEEASGRLTVRLLMPTGLCFLPAFVFVGVIPSIVSFVT